MNKDEYKRFTNTIGNIFYECNFFILIIVWKKSRLNKFGIYKIILDHLWRTTAWATTTHQQNHIPLLYDSVRVCVIIPQNQSCCHNSLSHLKVKSFFGFCALIFNRKGTKYPKNTRRKMKLIQTWITCFHYYISTCIRSLSK